MANSPMQQGSHASVTQLSTIKAKEPALFLSIYLHRQRPEGEDPRSAILRQVQTFVDSYQLQAPPQLANKPKALYEQVGAIDLRRVDSLHGLHTLVFEANTGFAGESGVKYETVIYAYHDSIIIQLLLAKPQKWQGSLKNGCQELFCELRAGFGESIAAEAEPAVFGVSALYWIIADDNVRLESYESDINSLMGSPARRTETDLGPLRFYERTCFLEGRYHQDVWLLATRRDSEVEVNDRYYQLDGGPPPFGQVALARHKIFFELAQYRLMRKVIEDRGKVLDKETLRFLVKQRRLGPKLNELASETAVHFEEQLTKATNRLAGYRRTLGRAQELRRTLEVNHRNYTLQCLRLISKKKYDDVVRSQNRLLAAINVLDGLDHDEIFSPDLGLFAQHCQQVDTDLGYSESVAERHTQALRSASEQLRIAGEREIAEMARHMAVDSAAVVASLAALVVIELADKRHYDSIRDALKATAEDSKIPSIPFFHSLEGWLLVGSVILLVYGLAHAFGSRFRSEKSGRKSIVAGLGLMFAWAGTMFIYHHGQTEPVRLSETRFFSNWLPVVLLALAGASIAYVVYQKAWNWLRKRRRTRLENEL